MARYLDPPPPWPLSAETKKRLEECPNKSAHRDPPLNASGRVDTQIWRQRRCTCDLWAIWERKPTGGQ